MAARKVWRIPVIVNSRGDIVKIWKPRSWKIDSAVDYYEPEIVMRAFNERKVKKAMLTGGLPQQKNYKLVIRKDDGKTKSEVFKMYDLLITMPTIKAVGSESEFEAFLKRVLPSQDKK